MDEVLNALQRVVEKATFNVDGNKISSAQIRRLYHNQDVNGLRAHISNLAVNQGDFSTLSDALIPFLQRYMHEETGLIGNGFFLCSGGSVRDVYISVEELAKMLVVAGAKLETQRVVELFEEWINGICLRIPECVILEGLEIETPFTYNGIEIFKQTFSSDIPIRFPSLMSSLQEEKVVASRKVNLSPALYKPSRKKWTNIEDNVWAQPSLKDWSIENYESYWNRFCEAVSLVLGSFVGWQRVWREWDELNAFQRFSRSFSSMEKRSFDTALRQKSFSLGILTEATEISRKRKSSGVQGIDLAIRRWVRSYLGEQEDQLIDLRIALEALYVQGAQHEIAKTVAARGAWHLGGNFEERRTYYEILQKLYQDASRVIHAGSAKYVKEDDALLDQGREACRKAILAILNDGTPDWTDLVLGKAFDF